jgi:hypothetical protein
MAKLKISDADLGDFLVPKELFRKNGKISEKRLKEYLKDNVYILENILKPKGNVFWLGQEFKKQADFLGVDGAGYIVEVEVKVHTTPKKIIPQIENHIKTYRGLLRKNHFKKACEDYAAARKPEHRMLFADTIIKKEGSFDKAYKKLSKGKRFVYKGIKIFVIAPSLYRHLSAGFAEFERKHKETILLKWVLTDRNPKPGGALHYCAIATSKRI